MGKGVGDRYIPTGSRGGSFTEIAFIGGIELLRDGAGFSGGNWDGVFRIPMDGKIYFTAAVVEDRERKPRAVFRGYVARYLDVSAALVGPGAKLGGVDRGHAVCRGRTSAGGEQERQQETEKKGTAFHEEVLSWEIRYWMWNQSPSETGETWQR